MPLAGGIDERSSKGTSVSIHTHGADCAESSMLNVVEGADEQNTSESLGWKRLGRDPG